jgi:translation initiation factor IF-2|tara:strand:- start:2197 stop:4041 length:1845 start_codon:yes stop_codon:yes gene_type:complete
VTEVNEPKNVLNASNKGNEVSSATVKARPIKIPDTLTVKQLASLMQVSAVDVIKRLMRNGIMANINQSINYEAAAAAAVTFGFQAQLEDQNGPKSVSLIREIKEQQRQQVKEIGNLKPRPPVVTVMGHVDHGKTRLLDAIRKTNVIDGEAGGITQRIGAYQVEVDGQKITFLDTPGHEAFTAMRSRGARVTDIAILVVAADDGVMPQTLEALNHAQAADVPIIVAINKMDKPEANPERIKQQLAEAGLVVEEWGGDTVCTEVSAQGKKGISKLLENLLVVTEMEELKADYHRPAEGVVIEANMDKTKGPLATVLVHNGILRVGDIIVVNDTWGKLKAMFNSEGKQVRRAEPSTPVEILGLGVVPPAGDTFTVMAGESQARTLAEKRKSEITQKQGSAKAVSLTNLMEQVGAGQVRELNVILKTDVQGSIEPIRNSLEQLATEELKVRVLHSGTGAITENDIMLALASKGIIIGFNTNTEAGAKRSAEREGISIRNYNVIYNLIDDVGKALKGLLAPSRIEVIIGRAEIRAVFSASKKQNIAGSYVTEGKISRGSSVRVRSKNQIVKESTVESLRRFKENVTEVATGYECGVIIKDFNEFKVGDILEFFKTEKVN